MPFNPNKPAPGDPLYAEDIRENFRALVEDRIVDADKVDGYHASSFLLASDFTSANILAKLQNHPTQPLPINADLLDGYHASSFLLASDFTSANILAKLQNHSTQPLPINVDRVDGYHAGNSSGQIPVSNGTLNTNLNADMVDGYHASSFLLASNFTSANILAKLQNHPTQPLPINADLLDGYHASSFLLASNFTSANILAKLQNHSVQPLPLNVDMVDGYHASNFATKNDYKFLFRIAHKRRYTRPQRMMMQVGNFSGSEKWRGGVYVPYKDETYCVPSSSTSVLVVKADLSTRQFGNLTGWLKYENAVLGKDGKIYCAPMNANQILVINPLNDSIQLMGDFSGTNKFSSPSAVNDWVVFLPRNASYILKYNISTAQFSTVSVSWKQVVSSLVGPDGWIYFCAQQGSTWNLGKYNPDTNQVIWLQTGLSENHSMGSVWGNKIIFGHRRGTTSAIYRILDLETGEIRRKEFNILPYIETDPSGNPATTEISFHVLSPDGLVYGFPLSGCILVFDPENENLVEVQYIHYAGNLYYSALHRRFVFGTPITAPSLYVIVPYDECQPYP